MEYCVHMSFIGYDGSRIHPRVQDVPACDASSPLGGVVKQQERGLRGGVAMAVLNGNEVCF